MIARLVSLLVLGLFLIGAPAAHGTPCNYTTRVVNVAIPNGPGMSEGVSSSVWVPPPFQPGDGLEDVNVGVNVVTPDAKDLTISVAHGGTAVTLTAKHGAGAATTFDDEAGSSINGATAPFAGSFKPDQPLSTFDTKAAQGVWKLTVKDTVSPLAPRRDAPQTFVSWTLSFAAGQCSFPQPPCDEHGVTFPTAIGSVTTFPEVRGKGLIDDVDVHLAGVTAAAAGQFSADLSTTASNVRQLVANGSIGAGSPWVDTVFDDDAPTSINTATGARTGRFRPVDPLGQFNGLPVSTRFSLHLVMTGTTGSVTGYGLRVDSSKCVDTDGDVIFDASDNCEAVSNLDQVDYERDALGDVCDDDDDNDGVLDAADRCPQGLRVFDTGGTAADYDGDGCRDPEDADDDDDGVADTSDGCPQAAKGPGGDTDGDGCKDFEDADDDGDGVLDTADRCPLNADPAQTDTDGDRIGDACDPDDDGDGVIDSADAFPLDATRSAPPPAATPTPTPTAAPVAPRISALKLSKRRIQLGRKATITYAVSVASRTRFTVFALKRCGTRKRCRPSVVRRRFTHVDKAGGKVKLVFRTKGLKKGRFRLQAVGRNAAGAGKAASITFRVR